MIPNQFKPSAEWIKETVTKNETLPEGEQTCIKCGHVACSSCKDWCDCILTNVSQSGNWEGIEPDEIYENGDTDHFCCCDMTCTYFEEQKNVK